MKKPHMLRCAQTSRSNVIKIGMVEGWHDGWIHLDSNTHMPLLKSFRACANFSVAILNESIQKRNHRGGTERASKEFLIKKYSELCELRASVVK